MSIEETLLNESLNGVTLTKNEGTPKEKYAKRGFQEASSCQAKSSALSGFLHDIYNLFLNEQKLDKEGIKAKLKQLEGENIQKESKKNQLNSLVNNLIKEKENKEKRINETELERIAAIGDDNPDTGGTIPFVIGAFITILLTFYLFVFYSSAAYSTFYGVKPGDGPIRATVFADALSKGGGVIAMVLLFPVIFLGLGFLIHDAIEKIKKGETKVQKLTPILTISALLIVTLIADAFIGYKIAQGVHNNEYEAGLSDSIWDFQMIYSDVTFYLVLILGFVVYIIWGFLLNFVLSHDYLKTESEKVKLIKAQYDNILKEYNKELLMVEERLQYTKAEVITVEKEIEHIQKDINNYENGAIPINTSLLKASVGQYMGGWYSFIKGFYEDNKVDSEISKIQEIENNWMRKKLSDIDSTNKQYSKHNISNGE